MCTLLCDMKREEEINMKKLSTVLFLIILIMVTCFSSAFAQVNTLDTVINTPYEYPVTPYDEEWSMFTSKEEMIEACQIPENILYRMSTEALLETVLNYPFIIEYFAYNNYSDAAEKFIRTFNGFKELYSRNDLTEVLLSFYANSTPMTVNEYNAYGINPNSDSFASSIYAEEICTAFFNTSHLEFLIAYDQIINDNYTVEEAETFDNLLLEKINLRNANELYTDMSETYVECMVQEAPAATFSAGSNVTVSTVTTPAGTKVEVLSFSPDYSSEEKAAMNTQYDNLYPSAQRMSSATSHYNCHSYAWYSQATSNRDWMNGPSAAKYTTDGSYTLETSLLPSIGMKVFYMSDDHSAIVKHTTSATNVTFISKWGRAGVYIHNKLYSPYDASSLRYFS